MSEYTRRKTKTHNRGDPQRKDGHAADVDRREHQEQLVPQVGLERRRDLRHDEVCALTQRDYGMSAGESGAHPVRVLFSPLLTYGVTKQAEWDTSPSRDKRV